MKSIRLNDDNLIRVEIHDSDDKPTGEYLTFDLEDIELPLRYQQVIEEDKRNREWVRNQFIIIDRKEDVKGKKLLSKNQEDKIKVLNDFYIKEMKTIDLFLGENGCRKILNGRKPYYEMFEDIMEVIKPILEEMDKEMIDIEKRIKNKYKVETSDTNVLE